MDRRKRRWHGPKLYWILFWVLLIVVFVFFRVYSDFTPAGKFSEEKLTVEECSFTGFTLTGFGETKEGALDDLSKKKEDYGYLYCNGRFKGDPPDTAIKGIGCSPCRPYCETESSDVSDISYGRTSDDKITASQKVRVHCK